MRQNITKLNNMLKDIIFISRATNTKNKKFRISTVVIFANLTAASDIGIILIFSSIITGSFQSDNPLSFLVEFFIDNKIFIPLLVIIRFIFVFINSIIMKKLEFEIIENLRTYFLKEIFKRSNYSISDAYFYINSLTGHISFFYSAFTSALNGIVQFFAYSAYLLLADPATSLFFVGGIVILYYPLKIITKSTRKFTDQVYWQSWSVFNEIEKLIENIYLIKVLKKDRDEISNFDTIQKKLNQIDLKKTIYNSVSGFIPTFLTMFVLGILVNFPRLVTSLTLDFIGVTLRLFQALGNMSKSFNSLLNSQIHIQKFIEFSNNSIPHNTDNYKYIKEPNPSFVIKAENISFKYANADIELFSNLNITIREGTHTVITGPNGSGKSTLLGLFSGIHFPNKGLIQSTTNNFGYIGATPFILKATLRENLTYGLKRQVDDEYLLTNIKYLELFKEEINYDLNKEISNKTLSSGQMQKIAFVRALVSDMNILLLDESTANLDKSSQEKIFILLKDRNITIINSTHEPENFKSIATNFIQISIKDDLRILRFS